MGLQSSYRATVVFPMCTLLLNMHGSGTLIWLVDVITRQGFCFSPLDACFVLWRGHSSSSKFRVYLALFLKQIVSSSRVTFLPSLGSNHGLHRAAIGFLFQESFRQHQTTTEKRTFHVGHWTFCQVVLGFQRKHLQAKIRKIHLVVKIYLFRLILNNIILCEFSASLLLFYPLPSPSFVLTHSLLSKGYTLLHFPYQNMLVLLFLFPSSYLCCIYMPPTHKRTLASVFSIR